MLVDELRNGFVSETGTPVGPLEYSTDSLPTLSEGAEIWIKERLLESHGEYYELSQKHWQKIVDRDTADGKDPQFTGEDLYDLFCEALDILDPEHESGITIEKNSKSGLLSWNTPTLSVRVGTAERKTPVDSPEKAFAKLLHELVAFHGGRTKSGLETDAPILGMGVYCDFDPENGELPDYLTIEEGAASLAEAILAGEIVHDGHSQWEPERLRLYMNTAMATLEQRSSREIYEITWRYTVLMRLGDNEEPSEAMINRARKEAATSLERYERGVPANLPKEVGRIGFHKDIAYLNGRIKAIQLYEYFAENNDVESFSNFQKTKTDPTNRRQNKFAADHGYPVRTPMTLAAG